MVQQTAIEWADHTFNPWEGCQKVGPGCDHCYAEARNARFAGGEPPNFGPGAPRRRTSAANWQTPLRWQEDAAAFADLTGRRQRVFCASLADVFDNAVDPQWRADLALLILKTPDLDWLLLTKRIGNAAAMLKAMFGDHLPANVWLGATVVDQAEADRDIPKLLAIEGPRIRFLSIEPLLGPISLEEAWHGEDALSSECWGDCGWCSKGLPPLHNCASNLQSDAAWMKGRSGIDWIIVGGESGREARPMHFTWVRSLRDQCAVAGVPFLFKQWGEWAPVGASSDEEALSPAFRERRGSKSFLFEGDRYGFVGKKRAGRLLDGVTHDGVPA